MSCASISAIDRRLVLGLGNELLRDDAVGLRIATELRQRLVDRSDITVHQTEEMGLSLLDAMVGFDSVVLIDAIRTGVHPAGFVHVLDLNDFKVLPGVSPHFMGVGELVELGRELGQKMPREVKVMAVEVSDPYTVSTRMTPELEGSLPSLIEQFEALLRGTG